MGKRAQISAVESRNLKNMLKTSHQHSNIVNVNISFLEGALKKRVSESGPSMSMSQYIDIGFLIPTSNIYERLFRKTEFTLNERKRTIPQAM